MAEKAEVLLVGPPKPVIVNGLATPFTLHRLVDAKDRDALFADIAPRVRALAVSATLRADQRRVDGALSAARDRRPPSGSATTTSIPSGRTSTASSSPTRRTC